MPIALAVAVGGAAGALARYGLDAFIERRSFAVFPWSTLVINVSGCFVIGALIAALVDRHELPGWVRAGLVIGFLGGYTTFSTFAQETLDLVEAEHFAIALAYALGSLGAGVTAVYLGSLLGRGL
jgi:fluoride exporter